MGPSLDELIEESRRLPQDSRRDNRIVRILKGVEPQRALEVIKGMVLMGCPNSRHVAWRVLNDREVAEPFYIFGLAMADASTIKDWIEFAKPRIGLRRVLKHLKRRQAEEPGIVEWARYWFPRILSDEERGIAEEQLGV